ncbi:unnamed protein product [Cunninghamella blakesleeana]
MACRSASRANQARKRLLEEFPHANIDIELVDVGNMMSVFKFCDAIKNKYTSISHLFCNAGILSALGINWKQTLTMLLLDPVGLIEKSDATHQAVGEINEDGIGKVFAANVLGHYVMVRELERLLVNSGEGRIIWASSITASSSCFDIKDWQGIKSDIPYESSKWACDLLSVACHEKYQKSNLPISSFTTSPGVVASNIGELPRWITELRILLHYIMRWVGVTSQNISGYNGAFADLFVALEPLSKLDYIVRYLASTDRWGKSFIEEQCLNIDRAIANQLEKNCDGLYQSFKKSHSK